MCIKRKMSRMLKGLRKQSLATFWFRLKAWTGSVVGGRVVSGSTDSTTAFRCVDAAL